MSIVRSTLRDDTLKVADAFGAKRWDASAGGEVDRRISGVYDKIWRRLLNANRYYRVSKRTPSSDGVVGRYLVSDLSQQSDPNNADTLERLYRVLQVIIDGRIYDEAQLTDWAVAEAQNTGFHWYQTGTTLTALPLQTNKQADAIWVNWIPQRPSALSGDTVAVDFPDGYDDVLIHLSAARLLMKGGAETQASLELKAEVAEDYEEMLQDAARFSTNPLIMHPTDTANEWGG